MLQLFSASEPFEVVGIDILGPLPRSAKSNVYIVVMVDRFSRWPELEAVSDITAETVADVVMNKLVLKHGCPIQLLSDRGTQFTSRLLRRLAKRLGIKKVFTTAYHSQTNGQVERFNRYITTSLTAYVDDDQSNWDDYLESLAFAYRTSVVDAIGDTPFHLVHGRDPRLPTAILTEKPGSVKLSPAEYSARVSKIIREAFNAAQRCQAEADEKRKMTYDSTHHNVEYQAGELVLLHNSAVKQGLSPKLHQKWQGPYREIQRFSPVNYELRHVHTGKTIRAHVQRMVSFCARSEADESDGSVDTVPEDVHDDESGDACNENEPDCLPHVISSSSDQTRRVSERPVRPPQWLGDYVAWVVWRLKFHLVKFDVSFSSWGHDPFW